MKEAVVQAEDYIDKNPVPTRSEANSEEEEEQQSKEGGKYYVDRRRAICDNINKKMCAWTEKQWSGLERAYKKFCK